MNLLISLLILVCFALPAGATEYTATQTGNLNESATWGGAGVPGDGDNAVIPSGYTVTVTANATVGDGVNPGIEIEGASAVSYGTLKVNDNITLTVKGADTSSNPAILVNRYGHFEPQAGCTIVIDCSSDYQTCIVNNGHLWSTGAEGNEITFTTATADRDYSNSVSDETVVAANRGLFDADTNIYVGLLAHRVISNAAGTGLGSYGDTSFTPGTCTPTGVMDTEVSSYVNISDHGDYYVDYSKGVFYFKCTSADPMSIVISAYKYLTFYGSGILSQANTDDSSCTFNYTNFEYLGSNNWSNEYLYGALMIRYKYHEDDDSDRKVNVGDCTFSYCYRPLSMFNCIGTADGDAINVTFNTFDECWFVTGGSYSDRAGIDLGYSEYLNINSNTFDVIGDICGGTRANHNIEFINNSGRGSSCGTTLDNSYGITVENNTFQGYGKLLDATCIGVEGTSSGYNYYQNNEIACDNRAVRLGSYMIVRRNKFSKCYHHGVVTHNTHGYIHSSRVLNNLFYDSDTHVAATFGGGLTTGYNKQHWIDNVVYANNTSNDGDRGITLNDEENGSAVLVTRTYLVNNIISNGTDGIYYPAETGTDETQLAPYRIDYNVDYNTSGTTNVVQASFTKSGNDYNTWNGKNLLGFCLFDPDSSYSMPITNKTLALTVSGSAGTNLAYDVVWDGGSSVDLVLNQGTASSGTTSTLVDSGAGWTTNAYRCDYVKIHSGTGSGQIGMIKSNTSDTLSIIAQNDTNLWSTAPDDTSVYVIYDSSIQPAGSDTKTIRVGIYLPDPSFPTISTSDTGIGFDGHGQTGDPVYTGSSDFHIEAGSSAIDNGLDMSSYFGDDLDENVRSAPWDIGAYLYTEPSTGDVSAIGKTIGFPIKERPFTPDNYPELVGIEGQK